MITATHWILTIIAALVLGLSLWGMVNTSGLTNLVRAAVAARWGMLFAVGVRIVLGLCLLLAAPSSRLPNAFEVVGWLTLIAAILLPVFGRARLVSFIDRFQGFPLGAIRLWLFAGVLFSLFILYGLFHGA